MGGKGAAKVLEVVPSGISGDKNTAQKFAGVVIHCQEKGLLIRSWPPLMDGRIVLPEFAYLCALPSSPRFWGTGRRVDQQREMSASIGGYGFAIALESEASSQFISHELIIGRSLERQERCQKLSHALRPVRAMVTPREMEVEGHRVLKPRGPQPEEMRTADI